MDAQSIAAALGRPTRHGKGWRCLCPAHDDASPSLDIDPGADGRLLFACRASCSNADVLAALKSRGLWPPAGDTPRRTTAAAPPSHGKFGRPTDTYRYLSASGDLVGVVCRWDLEDGKQILPALPTATGWRWAAMPAPRPLYRLGDLLRRTDAQVLVVEGERKADDAAMLLPDLVVVSWAGGSQAMPQTDWTPLAGRRVLMWPDNDDPGDKAMARVAGMLMPIAAEIKLIRRDTSKTKGWDVGEAIRTDGWSADQVVEFMQARVEVWADKPPAVQSSPVTQLRQTSSPIPKPALIAPPTNSEDMIAEEFCRRHATNMRHVAAWGRWFHWSGTHWKEELTLLAFDMARHVARDFAAAAEEYKPGSGKSIAQSRTWAGVVRAVAADRRVGVASDIWDTDKWTLNTPGGTVDLRSGEVRPANPNDHITKITNTAPDFAMPTPEWNKFIARVTNESAELISFLRRMAGYSLTAETREHALFFLYGLGANGKSTFVNTIAGCMGDYAVTSPIETFTEQKSDKHLTEIARLRGARLVTSTETSEGRRWNDSRINQLTAGDKVAANFMRQDMFEFVPQFKLVIAGNHKPGLRSVTEGVRRRFNLLPFTASIPVAERDQELPEKLRAEWPGILAWMISGCVEWQETGLRQPKIVSQATAEYMEAEDAISAWLEDCCERDTAYFTEAKDLFASWRIWSEASGEYTGSQKGLGQKLEAKGLYRGRGTTGGRGYNGIRLKQVFQNGGNQGGNDRF